MISFPLWETRLSLLPIRFCCCVVKLNVRNIHKIHMPGVTFPLLFLYSSSILPLLQESKERNDPKQMETPEKLLTVHFSQSSASSPVSQQPAACLGLLQPGQARRKDPPEGGEWSAVRWGILGPSGVAVTRQQQGPCPRCVFVVLDQGGLFLRVLEFDSPTPAAEGLPDWDPHRPIWQP